MTDWRAYWICFSYVKGIGSVRFKALLDTFGDAETAWKAPPDTLHKAGLGAKIIENFRQVRSQIDPDQLWERLQRLEISALTWEDEGDPFHAEGPTARGRPARLSARAASVRG